MKEKYEQVLDYLVDEMKELNKIKFNSWDAVSSTCTGMKDIAVAMETIGEILITLDSTDQAQKTIDNLSEQLKNSF